jgi:hypothetical protein
MNRKMTDLALAVKWGCLGASGDASLLSAAAAKLPKNPSAASMAVRAVPVNPMPVSQRNSRRVRPQGVSRRLEPIPQLRVQRSTEEKMQQRALMQLWHTGTGFENSDARDS